MYIKTVSWPRKREMAADFQDRLNKVVAMSGEIEELRLFERGDFLDVVLIVGHAPGSGQIARVFTPDDLDEVVDAMSTEEVLKETTAKLTGLIPLNGGIRYVGTVISRPAVEEVKRDAEQGQDENFNGSAKRGKQRRVVSSDRKSNSG